VTRNGKPARAPILTIPPRRVLVGQLLVEEDPAFDPVKLTSPVLVQGHAAGAGTFWAYATLHDRVITVLSDYRPPLRVSLAAIVEAMLTAKAPKRTKKPQGNKPRGATHEEPAV
jgi:hypothetical protein